MTDIRRSAGQIALLILALLGVVIATYLTIVHYSQGAVPLVCSDQGLINCERVLTSSYSSVPGTTIPIAIPGLLWCIGGAVLAFMGWRVWPERRAIRIVEFGWTLLGMLTVLYLVYTEIVRLDAICLWCTLLHVIILIMFLVAVLLLQAPMPEAEFDEQDQKPSVIATRD